MLKKIFIANILAALSLTAALAAQAGMASVPGGSFLMGSPDSEAWRKTDEGPRTTVSLRSFLIADHETTFDEFDAYCAEAKILPPSDYGWGRGNRPVINVTWWDAAAYCNWRSIKEGLEPAYEITKASKAMTAVLDPFAGGYRLPTEAEWEFACRAGSSGPFYSGASLSSLEANFDGDYPYGGAASGPVLKKTVPVRSYAPNSLGLYDMHGNVWEWCGDYYGAYQGGRADNPPGAAFDLRRVCRGGAWISGASSLRSAKRNFYQPDFFSTALGFRVARNAPGTKRPDAVAAKDSGSLMVRTEPVAKAEIYIDGKIIGSSPNVFSLKEGRYGVVAKARRDGKAYSGSATVAIAAGVDERIVIKMEEDIRRIAGMAYVPAGSFFMGSPASESGRMTDEGPQHTVSLPAFFLAEKELVFEEYDAFCDGTGRPRPPDEGWGRGNRPVVNVSWLDAVAYCNWRSAKEGLEPVYSINGTEVLQDRKKDGYRLPTEAEWEYACRAGSVAATAYGPRISSAEANFDGTYPYGGAAAGPYSGKTQPAGSYPPNAFGLFDMHGNVNEWCWDRYDAYEAEFRIDPEGKGTSADSRVIRSGGWSDIGRFMRSAYRTGSNPELRNSQTGFRVARNYE
jgi:formylglycine-generating enzyme required for sulfatase activity